MNKIKIECEKSFTLKRGEVKVFNAIVTSAADVEISSSLVGFDDSACINCEGRDYLGRGFQKTVSLSTGTARRLWYYVKAGDACGVQSGRLVVHGADGEELASEELTVHVEKERVGNEQFNDIASLRRLYWLNSDYAIDHEVPKPFTPVQLDGRRLSILGRELIFGDTGLPESIATHFSQSVRLTGERHEILSAPITFSVLGESFANKTFGATSNGDGADIHAESESEGFTLATDVRAEFDGFCSFKLTLTAKEACTMKDARLKFPVTEYARKYFMGLGHEGGRFNESVDWKWSHEHQQDGFWVGNVNCGIRVKLKGSNYEKPLVNVYYSYKPLNMPDSWCGSGDGGIYYEDGSFVAYSGARRLTAGEALHFDFELIVTPMKPIDQKRHFGMRIFHKPPAEKIDLADTRTANVVNIHHGNDLNPYINYPFFESEALGKFIKNAHARGLLVKLYYTIRELTINLPEFQAFKDLGSEIFEKPRKPLEESFHWQADVFNWIREHAGDDVIPAWRQELMGEKYKNHFDSSVITDGQSRLCNFYVEGLRNLVEFLEIDGIYVDDVAYDRNTMKRVRKVLDKRPRALIDFHTWNHYTARAAFESCFNLYAELLPYIDKMWVGEGFDYDRLPDYWLVEISGIPFGLMSEMMCEGHPWRGLLFGMTTRLAWVPEADPTNIWELFDKYELGDAELIGPWDERNNVKLSSGDVCASLYVRGDKKYLAIANWANEEREVRVTLEGEAPCRFVTPEVRDFQSAAEFDTLVTLPAGRGLFLEVVTK